MNIPALHQPLAAANAAANAAINADGGWSNQSRLANDINSHRIGVVAEKLAMCAQSSGQKDDVQRFFHLCLSLARGIDYGVANNEAPAQASKLPPVLKMVCRQRNEFFLQAAVMVLMISVKNACKLGWFGTKDTEELLMLADEVGNFFSTRDINSEARGSLPTVSSVISRFYPRFKLGHIIASLEVKPGYGTYLVDFHISKKLSLSKEEKIRLFVAVKDNIDNSSCIISPQQVNILLNGRAVERRTNVFMDPGPQLPTIVNPLLKYGTNLLQAVGQFNGHYIIIIALMSVIPSAGLPAPPDYVQPDSAALSSDSEIIEGPSRISLNCPISYRRIRTPAKGHLCKHYQCFDLSNYVEINTKRPSWRCPHCNQSVCFTDLRVDQKMVKVLQEVGENVSEVIISADGSWTAASSSNRKDELHDKTSADQQEGQEPEESSGKSDAPSNVCDLTGDDEMDTADGFEMVDMKPVVHPSVQCQPVPSNSTMLPIPRSSNEQSQYSSAEIANGLLSGAVFPNSASASYNIRAQAQIVGGTSGALPGNFGITPVLTDAVTPALNRQPDNSQGTNYPTSSIGHAQVSASNNLHLQEALYQQSIMSNVRSIPRNVNRVPAAIQALPVQMPATNPQQNLRPTLSLPAASGSSVPFPVPLVGSNIHHIAGTVGGNVERQRQLPQSHVNQLHVSNMAPSSLQSHSAARGVGLATPSHNVWIAQSQTLSQPPHLMRSSQLPRSHVPQGVAPGGGLSNSPSTVQRVQLMAQQGAQIRQPQPMPLQTQTVRTVSSLPLNSGVTPQAVSRAENLIDLQSEKNWRPTSRMRGALTGEAYSAALSQFMGQITQPPQTPSPRPPVSAAPSMSPSLQAVVANRLNAHSASQVHNQPMMNAPATVSGAAGTQAEGNQGVN